MTGSIFRGPLVVGVSHAEAREPAALLSEVKYVLPQACSGCWGAPRVLVAGAPRSGVLLQAFRGLLVVLVRPYQSPDRFLYGSEQAARA